MREALFARLAEIADRGGRVSIAFHHLDSGEKWAWRNFEGEKTFPAASLIKLPLMAACYRLAGAGKIFLNERVLLSEAVGDGKEPFDDLAHAPLGEYFTLRKLIDRMITESDNTATNTLLERIGFEPVRELLDAWGLKETKLERKMLDWESRRVGRENTTTAEDMLSFLLQLQRGDDFPSAWKEEMWGLLTHQRDKTKMARRLPHLDLAHKTGEIPNIRHDVGRIKATNSFLLAVLTENLEKANTVIGRLSEAIVRHYDPLELIRPLSRLENAIGEGIVSAPLVHLRREPRHSSEMVSQALLGTRFLLLEKEGTWFHVQTPDGYLGWVREGNVSVDPDLLAEWAEGEKAVVVEPLLRLGNRTLSCGSHLLLRGDEVFSPLKERYPLQKGILRMSERADFTTCALSFVGTPYLWGGKSGWGIDCSGLTQLAGHLAGIELPRDADQQEAFLPRIGRESLERGDLVFFPGHVGIYLGEGALLHASAKAGEVRIESIDPSKEPYNPWLDSNLLDGARLPAY